MTTTSSFKVYSPILRSGMMFAAIVAVLTTLSVSSAAQQAAAQTTVPSRQLAAARSGISPSAARSKKPGAADDVTVLLFLPPVNYATCTPDAMVITDVNGDGKLDLVGATGYYIYDQGGLCVMLGNGDGTFQPAKLYPTGPYSTYSNGVAVADVNGDGKPDIVVANLCLEDLSGCVNQGLVSVLLGNGDGTFQAAVSYNPGGNPASLAIGDVNGDGKPDLVMSTSVPNSNSGLVSVMLGNGDGTFQTVVTYATGGYQASSLELADLNGKGPLDVVVANYCDDGGYQCPGEGSVAVLMNNGNGTFQAPVLYDSGGQGATSVTLVDVNGDGKLDLLVANDNSDTLGVLLGNGDGTFQPAAVYPAIEGLGSIAVADLNLDGKPDVVAASVSGVSGTGVVGVLLGNGNGTFQSMVTFETGYGSQESVAAADLSGDGKPDIILGEGSVVYAQPVGATVLFNISGSGSATTTTLSSSANPAYYGQTVVFSAPVTSGAGTPTGTVVFSGGPTSTLGTASVVNGTASLPVTFTTLGNPYVIIASYEGASGTFAPSQSASFNQAVWQAPTTTALVSSANPANSGQAVTYTVTVTGKYGGAVTGSVILKDNNTQIANVSLYNGQATYTTSYSTAALHELYADYLGDMNNMGSATYLSEQIGATTSTSLVSSANPAAINETVNYTATVVSSSGAAVSGTVTFNKRNGDVLAVVPVSNNQAVYSTSYAEKQTLYISATYSGDANDGPSTFRFLDEQINAPPYKTATTLTTSGSPSTIGQSVTFTASVTSADGAIPNGELVTFKDGSTEIGTGTTSNGTATFTTSSLSAKTHTIKATYAGDATFKESSGTVTQVVDADSTTTTISSSLNPSFYGQGVTWTATVTSSGPDVPTGKVKFTGIGTATLSGGVATISKTWLNVAPYDVTAEYEGDSNNAASDSPVLDQVINPATTTVALTSSANPSTAGQSVTFTATVSSNTGAHATGTVTFTAGATTLGTVSLSGVVATISTTTLPVGSTLVTATYNGATDFTGSAGSLTQSVNGGASARRESLPETPAIGAGSVATAATGSKESADGLRSAVPTKTKKDALIGTTTTLISSKNPLDYGKYVTFTVTVSPESGGGTATGSVTFYNGETALATINLEKGTAKYKTSTLPVGEDSMTAVYGGSTTYSGSTSSVLSEDVMAVTTINLTSSANPAQYGESVTFTATLNSSIGPPPNGETVTFSCDCQLGTGTLSGGVATFTTSSLNVIRGGSYKVNAVYDGDATFTPVTSKRLNQDVFTAETTTTLTSSVNPSIYYQPVTLSATVTSQFGSVVGTVTFKNGSTILGHGTLSNDVATLTTSAIPVGTGSLTARYDADDGDLYGLSTTATPISQVVNPASTTTTLTSSVNPSNSGQSVTFTANVVGQFGGTVTGTVTFMDGSTLLKTSDVNKGAASCTTAKLAAGTHNITATYSGSTDFTGSVGSVTQTVE